jgi:hypothetical protein
MNSLSKMWKKENPLPFPPSPMRYTYNCFKSQSRWITMAQWSTDLVKRTVWSLVS